MDYTFDKTTTGVVVVDCTQRNNRHFQYRSNTLRPLGPFAIHQACQQRNVRSTCINYLDFWNADDLVECIGIWKEKVGVSKLVIAASNLFSTTLFTQRNGITACVNALKENFDSIFILGGPYPALDPSKGLVIPDRLFYGRSLHLFEQWIEGIEPAEQTIYRGIIKYQNPIAEVKEDPIVPILYDDYCLSSSDIVSYEMRVGCKFNCTFCSYELRNAKKIKDSSVEQLSHFFQTAYDKFGITRFSLADDTFNEDTEKIETVAKAVENLTFKPKQCGFNRLDIMINKPEQVELLDRIGFYGHFFGLETLHPVAQKLIRKYIAKERVYDFYEMLKTDYPHWYHSFGYIVGLPGEPREHIVEVIDYVSSNRLVDAISAYPLNVLRQPGYEAHLSDFQKAPEKYGITLPTTNIPRKARYLRDPNSDESEFEQLSNDRYWYHDQMDKYEAELLSNKFLTKCFNYGVTSIDCWEALSRDAIGYMDLYDPAVKNDYKNRTMNAARTMPGDGYKEIAFSSEWIAKADNHIYSYIDRKKEYYNSL